MTDTLDIKWDTRRKRTLNYRHAISDDAVSIAHLHAKSWQQTYQGMIVLTQSHLLPCPCLRCLHMRQEFEPVQAYLVDGDATIGVDDRMQLGSYSSR